MRAALKENVHYLDDGIGIFCDNTRDLIKGDAFRGKEPGAVNGGKGLETQLLNAAAAWRKGGADFRPKSCAQIINYVSAHDNFTLWDKLVLSMCDKPNFSEWNKEIIAINKLAAFIYFTCQGRLFLQAGEEFGRTKFGEGNSYRSAPEINMLDWQRTVEFAELVEYYKGLIRLRKQLPGLYDKSAAAAERIKEKTVPGEGVVSFLVDNRESGVDTDWDELCVIYNVADKECTTWLEKGIWQILADGETADCRKEAADVETGIWVKAHSGMLLGKLTA